MQTDVKKPLVIKSASAGSGKTFSLVQDYLKLTLSEEVGPKNFAKIIAMTFTNKAAWEMKERIIAALDQLANINQLEGKERAKAEGLMEATAHNLQLPKEKITAKAKDVLSEILHNYEDFNVLTIDKFSLRLIRTFSRDLDLQDNFEVTLDEVGLLEKVIDDLLSKIGKEGEEAITELALSYAKSKLNEGDSWDFRKSLIQFSTILTKENEQEFVEALLEMEFEAEDYQNILVELRKIETQHKSKCQQIHEHFISLHTSAEDYPGKSRGIYGHLTKLLERDVYAIKAPSATIEKTLTGENVGKNHQVDHALMEMMKELYAFEATCLDRVYTLKSIRSNFYNLALLRHISQALNTYKEKENLIGIYEFGRRIAELLQRENTPYIYERLGNRYNHYLLDEFQDTSRLQWLNLIPLVHESIAQNHANLIVGDPKQAIYRFRNGLVEQFVALPKIYNPENDAELARTSLYFEEMGVKDPLDTNYRSKKGIVAFNNYFFEQLLTTLPEGFKEYYKDVAQIPNSNEGGYVEIQRYNSKDCEGEVTDFEIEFLLDKINGCRHIYKDQNQNTYTYGDICVLVRNKAEGSQYANALTKAGIGVVSSDSLLVSSDPDVQLCIDYLNLRRNTTNASLQIKFATSYYKKQNKDPVVELTPYWKNNKVGYFDFALFIRDCFDTKEELFFAYENLYDLGSKLLKLLEIDELTNPYIHHLMDIFQEYDLKKGPDIRNFIEDWQNGIKNSAIQMPENDEAVKIMTIHKSKGLEFPIVIIPRLTWKIRTAKNKHFIQMDSGELIYTNLSKDNAPELVTEKYQAEYQKLLLDELNVLYVALTRPSEQLYILLDTNLPRSMDYYTQLNQPVTQTLNAFASVETMKTKVSEALIEVGVAAPYGRMEQATAEHQDASVQPVADNAFVAQNMSDSLWFPGLAFIDEEAREDFTFNEQQRFGNQVHLVLAKVDALNTVDEVIRQLKELGELEHDEIPKIIEKVEQVNHFLATLDFVKSAESILNEQSIIVDEQKVRRPDRIYQKGQTATVVDFKTGEKESKHQKQVREYCKLLREMGFLSVKGYLLYTEELHLETVE